jgi:hypothetical protein
MLELVVFTLTFSILRKNCFLGYYHDFVLHIHPRLLEKDHKSADKDPLEEASTRRYLEEEDIDTPRPVYDDTKGFIDRETSLKWGEVYHMFNNQADSCNYT